MKRFRWDLIVAAALVALGLALHAALPRYQYAANNVVLDRWTGEMCNGRVCWQGDARIGAGDDAREVTRRRVRETIYDRPRR